MISDSSDLVLNSVVSDTSGGGDGSHSSDPRDSSNGSDSSQ